MSNVPGFTVIILTLLVVLFGSIVIIARQAVHKFPCDDDVYRIVIGISAFFGVCVIPLFVNWMVDLSSTKFDPLTLGGLISGSTVVIGMLLLIGTRRFIRKYYPSVIFESWWDLTILRHGERRKDISPAFLDALLD